MGVHIHKLKKRDQFQVFTRTKPETLRGRQGGGHMTTAILNQSAMTKWYPEIERACWQVLCWGVLKPRASISQIISLVNLVCWPSFILLSQSEQSYPCFWTLAAGLYSNKNKEFRGCKIKKTIQLRIWNALCVPSSASGSASVNHEFYSICRTQPLQWPFIDPTRKSAIWYIKPWYFGRVVSNVNFRI